MKYIFILSSLLTIAATAQDTLYMKAGQITICTIKDVSASHIRVTDPNNKNSESYLVPMSNILRVGIKDNRQLANSINLQISFDASSHKNYGKAGKFLITSGSMFVAAGGLSLLAYFTDVPELSYVGGAAGGLGVVFMIASGAQAVRGSKKVKNQVAY